MIVGLLVKMAMTAAVVIIVTLLVGRLGPRIGGIVAGTPIVLGPAFFFLVREQTDAFVAHAAVSTLHALASSLLFLMCFVAVAGRLDAIASVAAGVAMWLVAALVFVWMPAGLLPALVLYTAVFALALWLERRLRLQAERPDVHTSWHDLLARGITAGMLVGIATTIGAHYGPVVSGTLTGFPVGFVVISLTLHQRYGAPVARSTLVAAQRGMLSLVMFAAAITALTPVLGGRAAFLPALVASLLVSALLAGVAWYREVPG